MRCGAHPISPDMGTQVHTNAGGGVGASSERRAARRIAVKGLWCDRGQVIDLSDRGMRIRTLRRWCEGSVRTLTLVDGPDSVAVQAHCVWCRQDSMFSHHVGIAFQDPSAGAREALARIAARHHGAGADAEG